MSGTGAQLIQNIFSGIHISVMHTATFRTNPAPLAQNVAFEKLSYIGIGRLVDVPAVRFVNMAVAAKRDQIRLVKPQIRLVAPSLNMMNMQPHSALLAKSAGVIVPALDLRGNFSELVSEQQALRAHWRIFRKASAAPLLFRSVVRKNLSALALQASAGLRIAGNERISTHLHGAAAVAAACDARITILAQHNQSGKSLPGDWLLIGKGRCGGHFQKVRAGASEAST